MRGRAIVPISCTFKPGKGAPSKIPLAMLEAPRE